MAWTALLDNPAQRLLTFILSAIVLAVGASMSVAVRAQEPPKPGARDAARDAFFLVASPQLVDPAYRRSVLLVVPAAEDMHVGLIINRPTSRSLASLFPEHVPSKKVVDPVYFGGPMVAGSLVALVHAEQNPGAGSIELLEHLYLCMHSKVIDQIIETRPNEARYYAGMVQWRPGELQQELNRGLWHVFDADESTVFRKNTEGLWEELLKRASGLRAALEPPPALN
jgi:putative transcriptional regulator